MKLIISSLLFSCTVFAQLPESDIWLFSIKKKDSVFVYTNPINITHKVGYENQPAFSNDGKTIFYTRNDSTGQTDIYQYSISKKTHHNLTKSKVSEYSSTVLPSDLEFSAVVVEKDSIQRIWRFDLKGSFKTIVSEATDSIGYHTWLNKDTVLYYKTTQPSSLRVLDLVSGNDVWLCDYPTRSFRKIGNSSRFIYGIKNSSSVQFRIYNPVLKESVEYANYPVVLEDFIWDSKLGLILSNGSDLLRFNDKTNQWEVLFSFSKLGIKKISRFIFDSKFKQLAIVTE